MTLSRKPDYSHMRNTFSAEHAQHGTAAHYGAGHFPVVPEAWTIKQVDEHISKNGGDFDEVDYIYVQNSAEKLVGVLSIRDLFRYAPTTPIKSVMKKEIIYVRPDTHRERIAHLALQHNLRAIPIVKQGKLVGVIVTNKILHIINRTLHEHILSFSGVHHAHLDYEDTMHIPIRESIVHRAPWLLIGLVGVIIAAGIMDQFASVLDEHLIVAFFIPAILYMSNALGTQNQTLYIRDISIMGKELKTIPYFVRTLIISIIISLMIAMIVYGIVFLLWKGNGETLVISAAIFATLMISSITSFITAYLFQKTGHDPALGSGPLATIISDVTSIILYFVIVAVLL